jgi:hypothetical protein
MQPLQWLAPFKSIPSDQPVVVCGCLFPFSPYSLISGLLLCIYNYFNFVQARDHNNLKYLGWFSYSAADKTRILRLKRDSPILKAYYLFLSCLCKWQGSWPPMLFPSKGYEEVQEDPRASESAEFTVWGCVCRGGSILQCLLILLLQLHRWVQRLFHSTRSMLLKGTGRSEYNWAAAHSFPRPPSGRLWPHARGKSWFRWGRMPRHRPSPFI